MEMIAMLNGLGAMCPTCTMVPTSAGTGLGRLGEVKLSQSYVDFSTRIAAAKTDAELDALKVAIEANRDQGGRGMGLTPSEASALGVQILERREAIGPIHKRWWFYPALIGAGIVGYHLYKKNTTGEGIF